MLKEVFADLEFRTVGKRILGEDIPTGQPDKKVANEGEQMDLFGSKLPETGKGSNPVTQAAVPSGGLAETAMSVDKNIHNTPHQYALCDSEKETKDLAKYLSAYTEICFDTETTNIDPNLAELVGMSFQ